MRSPRWDHILDSKPVPVVEHVIKEVSKFFADDLKKWPPEIDEFDDSTGSTVRALLAESPKRPDTRVYVEAFRIARFDIAREFEAHAEYFRNMRWHDVGLTDADKPMLLFLSRYLTEQVYALAEATEGRINRHRMLDVLDTTERFFFPGVLS